MEDRNSFATTQLSTTNQAGYSFSANDFAAVEAVEGLGTVEVEDGDEIMLYCNNGVGHGGFLLCM